jgi:hypothetical protein
MADFFRLEALNYYLALFRYIKEAAQNWTASRCKPAFLSKMNA